jgi:hypothetical protein
MIGLSFCRGLTILNAHYFLLKLKIYTDILPLQYEYNFFLEYNQRLNLSLSLSHHESI